jgi:hypothetical protein
LDPVLQLHLLLLLPAGLPLSPLLLPSCALPNAPALLLLPPCFRALLLRL